MTVNSAHHFTVWRVDWFLSSKTVSGCCTSWELSPVVSYVSSLFQWTEQWTLLGLGRVSVISVTTLTRPTSMQKSCPVDTALTRCRRQVQPRVPDTVAVVTCADLRGRRHRAAVAVGRRQVDGVAVVSTQSRPWTAVESSCRGACRRDPRYVPWCSRMLPCFCLLFYLPLFPPLQLALL